MRSLVINGTVNAAMGLLRSPRKHQHIEVVRNDDNSHAIREHADVRIMGFVPDPDSCTAVCLRVRPVKGMLDGFGGKKLSAELYLGSPNWVLQAEGKGRFTFMGELVWKDGYFYSTKLQTWFAVCNTRRPAATPPKKKEEETGKEDGDRKYKLPCSELNDKVMDDKELY